MTAYNELESLFRQVSALRGAGSILHWDNSTMMPENSGDARGEQLAALSEVSHELMTQPKLGELFAKAESQAASLTDWQQANLREMKRGWQHETAVPADLVSALTKACHESELVWRKTSWCANRQMRKRRRCIFRRMTRCSTNTIPERIPL